MLDWINSNISIDTIIWLFPITFLLHDFEEIIFIESWFRKNYKTLLNQVPTKTRSIFEELSKTTAARFSIPVFLQFLLYIFSSFMAVEKQIFGMFIGFNVFLFLHIFTHIAQSLYFRTYALGVGTAILISFPYSIYLFYRLLYEKLINSWDIIINIPYGIITILVVLIGHKIASKILPN